MTNTPKRPVIRPTLPSPSNTSSPAVSPSPSRTMQTEPPSTASKHIPQKSTTPMSVSLEIEVDCGGFERPNKRHRIWIHRNGTITTPDHTNETDSQIEVIAHALNRKVEHACQYWANIPTLVKKSETTSSPDYDNWTIRTLGLVTQPATATAISGILGIGTHTLNDPATTLEYMKTYKKYGKIPTDPVTHITQLATPWLRETGWKRNRSTTPQELDELLNAGIPADRAASAAALNLNAATITEALRAFKKANIPPELLIQLAGIFTGEQINKIVTTLTPEQIRKLPAKISRLTNMVKETNADYVTAAKMLQDT